MYEFRFSFLTLFSINFLVREQIIAAKYISPVNHNTRQPYSVLKNMLIIYITLTVPCTNIIKRFVSLPKNLLSVLSDWFMLFLVSYVVLKNACRAYKQRVTIKEIRTPKESSNTAKLKMLQARFVSACSWTVQSWANYRPRTIAPA
jgi:hypothetical protein